MSLNKRKIEEPHGWNLDLRACGMITWLKRNWICHLVKMDQWSFGQWGLEWHASMQCIHWCHDRSFEFSMALLECSWSIEKSNNEQTGLSSNWSFDSQTWFLWALEQWFWAFDFSYEANPVVNFVHDLNLNFVCT